MSGVLSLLAQQSHYDEAWYSGIWRSLAESPSEWLAAVNSEAIMTDEHAWNLLSWIRRASSDLVRHPQPRTLQLAVFARALLTASEVDYREISLIVSLLRRAAQLSGVNYLEAVSIGCAQAGKWGDAALESLVNSPAEIPPTYEEIGQGEDFAFSLRPLEYDTQELIRRIGDGKTPKGK